MLIFGERIRQLRNEHNLTQVQVGERIHATKGMINTYETSSRYPSLDTVVRLARLFKVSTDYLLGVKSNITLDVSELKPSQISLLSQIIDEFKGK